MVKEETKETLKRIGDTCHQLPESEKAPTKSKRYKKKVTINFDPHLSNMLDEYCKSNNVFKNELITLLLLKFFDEVGYGENKKEVYFNALFPSLNSKNAIESNTLDIPELFKIYEYLMLKHLAKVDPNQSKLHKPYIWDQIPDPDDDNKINLIPRKIK